MIKIAGVVVAVVIAVGVGVFYWQKNSDHPLTKAEAIKQAQAFKPSGNCTQSLVRAIHKATGAEYTFPSGCLPSGWVRE